MRLERCLFCLVREGLGDDAGCQARGQTGDPYFGGLNNNQRIRRFLGNTGAGGGSSSWPAGDG